MLTRPATWSVCSWCCTAICPRREIHASAMSVSIQLVGEVESDKCLESALLVLYGNLRMR
jgi:hypothetical protein